MKKKQQKQQLTPIEKETQYVEFLRIRLNSENYKNSVSQEEYDKTKVKYDKAKFKLKLMLETKK